MRITNLSLLLLFAMALSAPARAETVTLTSLEWPPYTGEALEAQGATVAVAKAAFEAVGHELVVEFYPWRRTVSLAKETPGYDGYFPEYYAESLKEDFIVSEPIGSGPLGFAQRKDNPVAWESLDDLADTPIGVVSGYVNTTEFDNRVARGVLNTSEAGDDVKNLLKLAHGRIELAVVDRNVMEYLIATNPELTRVADNLEFNKRPLENKELFICFKKGARGEKLAAALAEGLKKIDVDQVMASHLSK